jgi:selT/selW/selH-like putative selenoprotein
LKAGERGSFEIFINNNIVFSKLQEDRFPESNEVVSFIEGVLNVT